MYAEIIFNEIVKIMGSRRLSVKMVIEILPKRSKRKPKQFDL